MTLSFFWALGALFLAFLAWAVMPTLGWRYLVGFSVLPLASFVIMSPFILPESPFYLASIGDKNRVEIELAKVSKKLIFFSFFCAPLHKIVIGFSLIFFSRDTQRENTRCLMSKNNSKAKISFYPESPLILIFKKCEYFEK